MMRRISSFLVVGLFLAAMPAAKSQERAVVTDYLPATPSTQKFWSTENKINFSILAAQVAADAITTQRGLNQGFREATRLCVRWSPEAWPVRRQLPRWASALAWEPCICCTLCIITPPSASLCALFLPEKALSWRITSHCCANRPSSERLHAK